MKRLLILGAGVMQLPIIQKARQLGLYTIVADYDPEAVGFKDADKRAIISSTDCDGILKLAREENIDGILTTSDAPVNVVAFVGQRMGLCQQKLPGFVPINIYKGNYLARKIFILPFSGFAIIRPI